MMTLGEGVWSWRKKDTRKNEYRIFKPVEITITLKGEK
jgi:hypothetical protein